MNTQSFEFLAAQEFVIFEFCRICQNAGFNEAQTKLALIENVDLIASRIKAILA